MYNDPNQPQQPPYGQPPPGQPPWEPPPQQPPYEQPQTQWGPPPQQPPYGQPQPQWGPPPQQYGQPPYGAPQYGVLPAQPPKRSLRWLWITLGIVGGIILLSCIGCGVLAALGVGFFAKAAEPVVISTQYYQAIERQQYAAAYNYVANNATFTVQNQSIPVMNQQSFIAAATTADRLGTVSSANVQGFNVNNNTATVTVAVTRGGQSYDVHLMLKQVGSNWKITSADGI